MKTIAKLMALCLLMGTLGFAQAAPEKKGDDTSAKKSDTGMKKAKKGKAKGKKKAAAKKKAADDKGMEKGADKK